MHTPSTTPKTRSELRKFGLVMTVPLALIAGYLWWAGSSAWPYLAGAGAFFLLSGLLLPQILRPIEVAWMKLAEVLSAVMTRVILTLAYFLVMTPFGIVLRLMGKDLLKLKIEPERDSYWLPVEVDGPGTRPDKPY